MAELFQIAHGIVSVLKASSEPEPLLIQLRGEAPQDIKELIEAIIDECTAGAVPLSQIQLGDDMRWFEGDRLDLEGVEVFRSKSLEGELLLYRWREQAPHEQPSKKAN